MKKILVLFENRHDMPDEVEGAVFHNINNPNDLNHLMDQCDQSLKDCTELILYVTGLSTALVTVISYCNYNMIPLTLMHHDKKTDKYIPQKVFIWNDNKDNIKEYVCKLNERNPYNITQIYNDVMYYKNNP